MQDESGRLAALHAYQILDTPRDPTIDLIARLAAGIFDAPIACVSLVDSHRLFLKAAHGVDATELGREPGLCVTTVETNAPRQVEDLLKDAIAAEHPLVVNAPNLRFYAGTPLRSSDGYALGTLCVLDQRVRSLDQHQMDCLELLGELVMKHLEQHRLDADRESQALALERYGAVVTDPTRELKLSDKVRQAQKLESLGVLAGGIAHDFNNILGVIMGNAGLALANLDDTDRAAGYLRNLDTASERASRLCDQLLAYSGGGQFTIAPLHLGDLVRDMSELLDVSLPKKARLTMTLGEGLPAIEGDPTQVRQVIMNVLTNAAEALEGRSGCIGVRTGDSLYSAAELSETFGPGVDPGRFAWFEVTDDGCGIEPGDITQLFDPFYTTKFSGHGLGMSAVLGIMGAHDGAIEIVSEQGSGTTVRLLFPVSEASARPLVPKPLVEESIRGSGTILVADDERALLEVVVATLSDAGYRTVTASDGDEAAKILDNDPGRFRAALIDMMMPNSDGAELHEHIGRVAPNVRVILTSGFNEREATRRITATGLAGFLKKPYRPQDLLAKLAEVLETPDVDLVSTSEESAIPLNSAANL